MRMGGFLKHIAAVAPERIKNKRVKVTRLNP